MSGIWTAHNVKASNDGKDIERKKERQRDRETERQRQRQRDTGYRETERQRDRETETETERHRIQREYREEIELQRDRPTERQINGFDLLLHFLWSPKRPGFVAQTVKRKTTSLTRLSISKLKSIKSSISTNGTL